MAHEPVAKVGLEKGVPLPFEHAFWNRRTRKAVHVQVQQLRRAVTLGNAEQALPIDVAGGERDNASFDRG